MMSAFRIRSNVSGNFTCLLVVTERRVVDRDHDVGSRSAGEHHPGQPFAFEGGGLLGHRGDAHHFRRGVGDGHDPEQLDPFRVIRVAIVDHAVRSGLDFAFLGGLVHCRSDLLIGLLFRFQFGFEVAPISGYFVVAAGKAVFGVLRHALDHVSARAEDLAIAILIVDVDRGIGTQIFGQREEGLCDFISGLSHHGGLTDQNQEPCSSQANKTLHFSVHIVEPLVSVTYIICEVTGKRVRKAERPRRARRILNIQQVLSPDPGVLDAYGMSDARSGSWTNTPWWTMCGVTIHLNSNSAFQTEPSGAVK